MASTSEPNQAIYGINVTPLVDIMLVLLIIFMVAGRIESAVAMEVDLPGAGTGEAAPPPTLNVVVNADGTVAIDGEPASLTAIERAARAAHERSAEAQALVAADRGIAYQRVVEVVDRVRRGGIRKVALAVGPEEQP